MCLSLQVALVPSPSMAGKKIAKCTLDKETQALIKLLFDNDMFKDTMKKFDIGNILDLDNMRHFVHSSR